MISVTYPNNQAVTYTYYEDDQLKTYTDLNGTTITHFYDGAGQLQRREITRTDGVPNPQPEIYEYDDIGRLVKASIGDSYVAFTYDRPGRVEKETQRATLIYTPLIAGEPGTPITLNGIYDIIAGYDANGNRTSLTYPSGKELTLTPDNLDRLEVITPTGETGEILRYKYEGMGKVVEKELSAKAVVMKAQFDAGLRPSSITYTAEEKSLSSIGMTWDKVDMKKTETRPLVSREYKYDSARRLRNETISKVVPNPADLLMPYQLQADDRNFNIDGIENLKSIRQKVMGNFNLSLDCDHNNLHQVSDVEYLAGGGSTQLSVHVVPSHDNNGNLTHFVHDYTYDYRDQLIRVDTGTGIVVEYTYDVLGRRVYKILTNTVEMERMVVRYIYDGWRVIEERNAVTNALLARYTYGNGIDERVEVEYDDGNGLKSYIPIHDNVGNVIAMTDNQGKVVEEYEYSTYGQPMFVYDKVPPLTTGMHFVQGTLIARMSESVNRETVETSFKVRNGAAEVPGNIVVSEDGCEMIFQPDEPLVNGEQLSIEISTGLEDTSGNNLEQSYTQAFTPNGVDEVLYDDGPPEVDTLIYNMENEFIIMVTDRIDESSIQNSVEFKSKSGTITGSYTILSPTSFKFTPSGVLDALEEYEMRVNDVKDLSGKTIQSFFHSFVVGNTDTLLYEREDPNKHTVSIISNNYLFHSRTYEPEVGLYYYRYRYYLPRLGRFLQQDPMGYKDSMNMYQAFNQNPVNFMDPMGLYEQLLEKWVQTKEKQLNSEDAKSTLRVMEGGANLVVGFAFFCRDALLRLYFPNEMIFRDRVTTQLYINLSEPKKDIFQIRRRKVTAWESFKEATVIIPTAEFIGVFIANVRMGYFDENLRDTWVGKEARDNSERGLIPMAVLIYGAAEGIGSRFSSPKSYATPKSIKLDLFGGKKSQITSAINVDIIAESGIKASATELPFKTSVVDEIIINNPYMKGGKGMMDYLPEVSRVLKEGGEVTINFTIRNKYGRLPKANLLEQLKFELVQEAGPLPPAFKNLKFRFGNGKPMTKAKIFTTKLRKK